MTLLQAWHFHSPQTCRCCWLFFDQEIDAFRWAGNHRKTFQPRFVCTNFATYSPPWLPPSSLPFSFSYGGICHGWSTWAHDRCLLLFSYSLSGRCVCEQCIHISVSLLKIVKFQHFHNSGCGQDVVALSLTTTSIWVKPTLVYRFFARRGLRFQRPTISTERGFSQACGWPGWDESIYVNGKSVIRRAFEV